MERQEKMDYAAVVCEYRTNGGGLKMKEWCQQEGYDYFKVRRYSKKEPMFPGLETNAAVAAGTPKRKLKKWRKFSFFSEFSFRIRRLGD